MKVIKIISVPFFVVLLVSSNLSSQTKGYKLPGKGLKQHDFVLVGEWDSRKPKSQSLFVVRKGKIDFQYSIPMYSGTGLQEFDDVTMLLF